MSDATTQDGHHHSAPLVDNYGMSYGHFAESLYAEVRREAFGEDSGQNSWLTSDELDRFMVHLSLRAGYHLLDVACGSGGPGLHMARLTGCAVTGIDILEQAIAAANALSAQQGLSERTRFERVDADEALPFAPGSFDAVMCIDSIDHLAARPRVLAEWARVLKPGGRLLFTDPIVVTGLLSDEEIAVRSSIGFFLFAPAGIDERLIAEAGLELHVRQDVTENTAVVAQRWHAAREVRAAALRAIEGDQTYDGQQEFFRVTAQLARERRLSRILYVAAKPL